MTVLFPFERQHSVLEPWDAVPLLAVTTLEDCLTGCGIDGSDPDAHEGLWCVYDPSEDDGPLAEGARCDMEFLASGWNQMAARISEGLA